MDKKKIAGILALTAGTGAVAYKIISDKLRQAAAVNRIDTPRMVEQAQTFSTGVASDVSGEVESANCPFTEVESIDKAVEVSGIFIDVPDEVDGATNRIIRVFSPKTDDAMVEIIYVESAAEDADEVARIRKAASDEDISGIYGDYSAKVIDVNDREVTLRGIGENYLCATWTEEGYSYSVSVEQGASWFDFKDLVSLID